jgi:LuxR family transcriptional regulator, maltose regulon positive regulatory protein
MSARNGSARLRRNDHDVTAPSVPRLRSTVVERPRLVGEAATEPHQRIVVVSAPPGYGKTTFAAQWCNSGQRPVAWLTLTDADNDARRLMARVVWALNALDQLPSEITDHLDQPGRPFDALLKEFLDALDTRPAFTLVLDDVHHLHRGHARQLVASLATSIPAHSQLVVLTRGEPGFPLARLRAAGDLNEVCAAKLAFNAEETSRLLGAAGMHVSEEFGSRVCATTEGWAAALALVSMSERPDDGSEPVIPASGTQHDIADYFDEEVLGAQPNEVRRFLLATSVVERFSGPLVDAMTGRDDSARMLGHLDRHNVFVVPLDEERRWYRYHHLFRALLLAHQGENREFATPTLLDRAAAWHERFGDPGEAFEYAYRCGDLERVGRVLLRHFDDYICLGRIETLVHWLDRLADVDIAGDAQLAIASGWVFAASGQTERARRSLAAAERCDLDRPSCDGASSLRAAMINLRGTLGFGGVSKMLEDGKLLIASETPGRTRWLLSAYRTVGVALTLLGRTEDATTSFREILPLSQGVHRNNRVFSLGLLSLLASDGGDWIGAQRWAACTDGLLDGYEHTPHRVPVLVASVVLATHRGSWSEASDLLGEAESLLPLIAGLPMVQAYLDVRCAEAASATGDAVRMNRLLEEARWLCARTEDPGVLSERIDRLVAETAEGDGRLGTLSPAELRVLRQLATHRTLEQIAAELYVSRTTVKTHVASIYSKLGVTTRADAVAALGTQADVRPLATMSP